MPGEESSPCSDCGVLIISDDMEPQSWEWYSVRDSVWGGEAGLSELQREADSPGRPPLYLCVGCLEARLGRELSAVDFSDYPVNSPSPLNSPRLNSRLSGWEEIRTAEKLWIAERNGDETLAAWLRDAG